MSIALVTTTINVPELLRQFREMRDDVRFIVVGDLQSPHTEIQRLCDELTNAVYLAPEAQEALGYGCTATIPYRCIQRRNIGLLEAIKSGADIIISWDDDNSPINDHYFDDLEFAFADPVLWIAGRDESDRWFNPGAHASQQYYYRGFPYSLRDHRDYHGGYRPSGNQPYAGLSESRLAREKIGRHPVIEYPPAVGIINGLVLGDPDCSATERLERKPCVSQHSKMLWDGIITDPRQCWAPFNSQNTAYIREIAPLMLLMPHIGRMDDIWGSLVAQRVMQETGYGVRFGRPFVHQDRNPHDLTRDLEQEMLGIRYTERFADDLRSVSLSTGASVLDNLSTVVEAMAGFEYLPPESAAFARAWVEDVGSLL